MMDELRAEQLRINLGLIDQGQEKEVSSDSMSEDEISNKVKPLPLKHTGTVTSDQLLKPQVNNTLTDIISPRSKTKDLSRNIMTTLSNELLSLFRYGLQKESALFQMLRNDQKNDFEYLVKRKVPLNTQSPTTGQNIVHLAIELNKVDYLTFLLQE